jgi:hypothetical protein
MKQCTPWRRKVARKDRAATLARLIDHLKAEHGMLDRDGRQIIKDGKGVWSPIVSFVSREVRDKFSHSVIEALVAAHPAALS